MKKVLYLIAIFCISQLSNAQSDFRDGFIINQDQDTTYGQIKYNEGGTMYHNCQFKVSDNKNIVSYKAGDIIGYGFKNDKYFQSKKIQTGDQSPEFVFLEVLISGKVTLFRNENVYYVEKAEQGLLKLSNKTESVIDGEKITTESKTYIGVLNLFLSDSPVISQSKIFRTTFNEKSLTDLVAEYNKSMNAPMVIYKYNKPWIHARFGITGGLASSTIALESDNSVFNHLGPYKRYNSPVFGATFEILSPKINENFSFVTNFLFCKSKYDSFHLFELGGTTTKDWTVIEMTHFKIPIGLKFAFGGKRLSSFINLGFSETFTLNSTSEWTQTVQHATIFDTYHYEALTIDKAQLGVWGGAGISKSISKGLSVYMELRYERTEGINDEDFLSITKSNVSNILFTVGIAMR